jgi:hypothetical protein
MLFNSADGWFQRTIALQNQRRLCIKRSTRENKKDPLLGGNTHLCDTSRIRLHQRTEPSER